ncbi:unnamed protein product, partial [Rotaria sordida]
FDKQKIIITKQLEPVTKEIHSRRDQDDFVESDIHRLRQQINEIQRSLQQLIGKDTTKTIIVEDDKIDWNRIIYIEDKQQN